MVDAVVSDGVVPLNSTAREVFECHSHCAYIEARDSYIAVI